MNYPYTKAGAQSQLAFGLESGVAVLAIATGETGTKHPGYPGIGMITEVRPLPVNVTSGNTQSAGDGPNVYYSVPTGNPDFNVTVSGGTRIIRLTNVPFTPDAGCIALPDDVKVLICGGTEVVRRIPTDRIRVTSGGSGVYNVVFSGMSFTFNTTDIIAMKMIGPTKNRDADLNIEQVGEISPVWVQRNSQVNLVTGVTIGNVDNTWKDQGSEIDMRQRNMIGVWVVFTANNTTGGAVVQILMKHTSAGVNEYQMVSSGNYQANLGIADTKRFLFFKTNNLVDYVQVQTKGTTLGATTGTVTIDITKAYDGGI